MKDINLFETEGSLFFRKISSKSDLAENEKCDGYLLDADEKECRRIIDTLKSKKKFIAVIGQDNEFNRRAIETLKINFLVSPERGPKKDSLKQRDSGLNDVVAKEASNRNIPIVLDLNEINQTNGKEKALRLSRIIQNIIICRKEECKILIANLAENKESILDEKTRRSFGMSLGMSTAQSKDSTNFSP